MDQKARNILERAQSAWDAEQWADSAACYELVLAEYPDEPDSPIWWYDAALAHKFLRDWDKAFELGLQAAARAPRGQQDPAFWNLGIAATVKKDWAVARDAWDGYGVNLPPGDGEIDLDLGTACVRLDPDGAAEVVWVRRICPTRSRVVSVPFRGRRFGEIILHDGAPNGERKADGRRYPVFDELFLWRPSDTATWWVSVESPEAADLDALHEAFDDAGLSVEMAASLVRHDRAQSEGSVELGQVAAAAGAQEVLLAAPDESTARRLLDGWAVAGVGRRWTRLRTEPGTADDLVRDERGSGHPNGQHEVRQYEWPFDGGVFPAELGVIAHKSVLMGERPALFVGHDTEGWWQAVDGIDDATPESAAVGCMTCLIGHDPGMAELADLPPGWTATRDSPDKPWIRTRHEGDTE